MDKKKLTLYLDQQTIRELKILAANLGNPHSASSLTMEALEDLFKKHKDKHAF